MAHRGQPRRRPLMVRETPASYTAQVGARVRAGAVISAVSWAEALSRLSDLGVDLGVVERAFRERGLLGQALEIVSSDAAHASEAARLRKATRHAGLSLGDRACLALGLSRGLPVLTADRAWSSLEQTPDQGAHRPDPLTIRSRAA